MNKKERYFLNKFKQIVGIDEVGRGALAGPLVLAGVNLDKKSLQFVKNKIGLKNIKDSKKLPPKQREEIYQEIKGQITWQKYFISPKAIDKKGLSKSIKTSLLKLAKKFESNVFLADGGLNLKNKNLNWNVFIKGDENFISIALASIIAKVIRDNYMKKISSFYPQYQFEIHKGYGTRIHLNALTNFGPSKIHRFSYKPVFEAASFGQKVYFVVSRIGKGNVLTYKQVAQMAGKPKAWRAVGNILNKNFDKNIPCHRVIRSDKKLGGYNRGKGKKETLLKKEGFSL